MKTILNVIWLVLSGFWLFLGYLLAGALLCITVIGIPFGIAAFRIGVYALWPFGYTTVERRDAGAPSCVGNVLWLVLAGWWLALAHIVTGIAMCITIIGIPFGIANFKLIPVSLFPWAAKSCPRTSRSPPADGGQRWGRPSTSCCRRRRRRVHRRARLRGDLGPLRGRRRPLRRAAPTRARDVRTPRLRTRG